MSDNKDASNEQKSIDAAESSQNEWTVHPANEAHIAAVRQLLLECVPKAGECSLLYLKWLRSAPQCRLFVVEVDAQVVACALLLAQVDHTTCRFGHIQALCVASGFRRRGIASALLGAAHNWFATFGAKYGALHVPKKASGPRALYAKHGYSRESLKKNYYENGDAALLLKKHF
jgi:ribosomal protein S18 acetylase RimI-like enzyme